MTRATRRPSLFQHYRLLFAGVLLFGTLAGCARPPAPPIAGPQTLGVAGRSNANAATAATGSLVVVTWTSATPEGGADVFASTSQDAGRSFSRPIQVNDVAGSVRLAGEQAPRVAASADLIAVVWTARESNVSVVRLATSHDRGQSFGPSRRVHPDGLTGARGWASVAIDARARVHVVWLDGRNATATPAHAMSTPMSGMDHASAPRQDIRAAIIDGDSIVSERLVAADTCFCCKTTVATFADGSSVAAWRHLFPSSVRDIAVAHLTAALAEPQVIRVSSDNWELHGCPEDGPAIGIDGQSVTHIAWPTLVEDKTPRKGVFYASSADGLAFSSRVRLDDTTGSHAAHPQIAVRSDGAVAVVWEQQDQAAHPLLIRTRPASSSSWTAARRLTADGAAPAVAALSTGFVVAWSSNGEIHTGVVPD